MKFLLIICAIVYLGAAIPINLKPSSHNTTLLNDHPSHLSVLAQFRKNPSTFVSQMSKADPTTLRTVLDLLRGLLTTSTDREEHLISTLNGKNDELNSANADVANAQTVLSDAKTDRANAQNAVTAAESDLAQKEGIAGVKLTEKNDAQGNHDAEIDSLNEEQAMIQEVITILEDLLGRQRGAGCSADATSATEVGETGIYACEGAWTTPGIEAGGIALCGASTELCDYVAINQLSTEQCSGVGNKFFGTKVSSHGGWQCEKHNDGSGTNDIWGCGTSCSNGNAACGILRCAVGNGNFAGWEGLPGSGGGTDETKYIRRSGQTGGGVMCCPKA